MNNEEMRALLALVVSRPGLRTVEIADKLDHNIPAVEAALASMVRAGELVPHDVIAPNGHAAIAYTVPGVALPAVGTKPAPHMTNVEKAVDYINRNGGTATSAQLHAVLGLKPAEYASAYLKGGIADGRLVKDGKDWTLGSGAGPDYTAALATVQAVEGAIAQGRKIAQERAQATPAVVGVPTVAIPTASSLGVTSTAGLPGTVLPNPVAARQVRPVPVESVSVALPPLVFLNGATLAGPAPASSPVPPAAAPKTAFALWSDGELHIARDGDTVLVLSPKETKRLFGYLAQFDDEAA